jgi:7,8-dihydropterin-6-yl-methyl-4-(beta-D-ribofuranosyl)aminobenzene 5'-phosphate synthase
MKLTILVDNNTLIDRYFLAEPGVAYLIEHNNVQYLFDAGYSDIFIRNAWKMGKDLLNLDAVIISHGDIDHTWGLGELIKLYSEAAFEKRTIKKPHLIAHPDAFLPKSEDIYADIGSLFSDSRLAPYFNMNLSKKPVWLTDRLVFLGEIERLNHFESKAPRGKVLREQSWEDDYILDDSALVYMSSNGLVVITGCSHSGICNIIEYAKKVCSDDRIFDVIGGFHLLTPSQDLLRYTANFLREINPSAVHACHCIDLQSKIELAKSVNIQEVGVGMVLEYF